MNVLKVAGLPAIISYDHNPIKLIASQSASS